ncbi:MAG: glycosyltransferase [Candidatus Deferrimicrobiaceae bacterium]
MEALLLPITLISVSMWVGLLLLPWQPWRNREVLEAEENGKGERLGDVTVLIPARNEAEVIGRTMASVATQGADLKILLIDDCSTDGTADHARQAAGEPLRILPGKPLPGGWGGKLWALEQGRRLVDTPMTLLLDADIELDPGILGALRAAMRKEGLAFVSLMAMPTMGSFREKLLMPAFVYFFKLLYPFALANKPSSKIAAAAGGCILLETRLLEEMGGFETMKDAVIDDCELARRVKSSGNRIWVGLSRSVRSVRPYGSLREIGNMVARTAYTQLRYSPALLVLCTLAMGVAFWVPIVAMFSMNAAVMWLAAGAMLAMVLSYLPTLGFTGRSRIWALCLPMIATFYLFMTWTSAIRFWKGERTRWKGRIYDGSMELGNATLRETANLDPDE